MFQILQIAMLYSALLRSWSPHWLTCLHWPFCPGVFIAIMGFWAAIVTFWEQPPRLVRVICTALFFALMWGEVWMMSEDRDKHDQADTAAQAIEQRQLDDLDKQSNSIGVLTQKQTTEYAQLALYYRKIDAAKGNPGLIAQLRAKVDESQKAADATAATLAAVMTPRIVAQLKQDASAFGAAQTQIDDDFYFRSTMPESDRVSVAARDKKKAQLRSEYNAKLRPLVSIADFLRKQLLLGLSGPQSPQDKAMEASFSNVISGGDITSFDAWGAAAYLDDLLKRIVPASPSGLSVTAN